LTKAGSLGTSPHGAPEKERSGSHSGSSSPRHAESKGTKASPRHSEKSESEPKSGRASPHHSEKSEPAKADSKGAKASRRHSEKSADTSVPRGETPRGSKASPRHSDQDPHHSHTLPHHHKHTVAPAPLPSVPCLEYKLTMDGLELYGKHKDEEGVLRKVRLLHNVHLDVGVRVSGSLLSSPLLLSSPSPSLLSFPSPDPPSPSSLLPLSFLLYPSPCPDSPFSFPFVASLRGSPHPRNSGLPVARHLLERLHPTNRFLLEIGNRGL
jgi:hypothetical protein